MDEKDVEKRIETVIKSYLPIYIESCLAASVIRSEYDMWRMNHTHNRMEKLIKEYENYSD